MTQDTTPTSGAADLPEALRSIQRFEVVDCIDSKHVPAVIPKPHGPWVRYADHVTALAAGQATAAQAVVAYAALPEPLSKRPSEANTLVWVADPISSTGVRGVFVDDITCLWWWGAGLIFQKEVDAAALALRMRSAIASHEQAPAGAWIERWHGSGGKDGYEGWSIVNKDDRALVAYLGRGVDSEAVTKIVMAHNATHTLRASHGQAPAATTFCWATELAMVREPVTLTVKEAREVSDQMQRLHAASFKTELRNLTSIDLDGDQAVRLAFMSFRAASAFKRAVEAEIALLKRSLLDAEAAPQPTTAQADSVQEDAACWHWIAEYLVGTRTDLDDEIVACETVNDLRKLVEAARKQGEKQ